MAHAELIELARSKRKMTADSLLNISMKALLTSVCQNLQTPTTASLVAKGEGQNPFENLPDSLVQMILALITRARMKESPFVPKESEPALLRMLLNKNVRSFNGNKFNLRTRDFDEAVLNVLLERCPNIERYTSTLGALSKNGIFIDEIPVERLATWTKLKHLILYNYFCTDRCLEQISRLLPELQGLLIEMKGLDVTAVGVQSLAKMENLTALCATYIDQAETDKAVELLVDIAGNVPHLRTFEICVYSKLDADSDFALLYGRRFPYKKLKMGGSFVLTKGIEKWPDCLLIEHLRLAVEHPDPALVATVCSVPLPMPSLQLIHVPSSVMNQVLETPLGAQLETLYVECSHIDGHHGIDLYRLVTCCPNLHELTFVCKKPFRPGTAAKLKPQHFRKMRKLNVNVQSRQERFLNESDFAHVWTVFLLGTEHSPEFLSISVNDYKSQALKRALAVNPDCLAKLRIVEILPYASLDEPIKEALQLAQILILNAPRLERIFFQSFQEDLYFNIENVSWFKELIDATGVNCSFGCYSWRGFV